LTKALPDGIINTSKARELILMMMNTAIGKAMAIWMLTGRWIPALMMFGVGFLYPFIVEERAMHRRKRVYTYVHDEAVKPKGEYRLGK
jgi:hypothetical protein